MVSKVRLGVLLLLQVAPYFTMVLGGDTATAQVIAGVYRNTNDDDPLVVRFCSNSEDDTIVMECMTTNSYSLKWSTSTDHEMATFSITGRTFCEDCGANNTIQRDGFKFSLIDRSDDPELNNVANYISQLRVNTSYLSTLMPSFGDNFTVTCQANNTIRTMVAVQASGGTANCRENNNITINNVTKMEGTNELIVRWQSDNEAIVETVATVENQTNNKVTKDLTNGCFIEVDDPSEPYNITIIEKNMCGVKFCSDPFWYLGYDSSSRPVAQISTLLLVFISVLAHFGITLL